MEPSPNSEMACVCHIIFLIKCYKYSITFHISKQARVNDGKETKRRKKQPYKEILFY